MILFYLTLLLVFELSDSAEESGGCSNCDDVKLSAEELRDLRLEYIKGEILSKLRLKNPPNVTDQSLPNLPNLDLLRDLDDDDDDSEENFSRKDYYGKTREIVIFSNNSGFYTCPNETNCFEFLLTSEVKTHSLKKAELWVRAENQDLNTTTATYTIFDVQPSEDNDNISRSVIANTTSNNLDIPDWLKFDVTFAVRSWVASGQLHRVLQMECDDVPSTDIDELESFIRIRIDLEDLKHPRRRRNHICSENSTFCCKEIFNVSFEEIGWHRWIFMPNSYNANFCRGSCISDISSARYFHTTVIRGFLQSDMATERNFMPSLCCSPFRMRSLMIIYITEDRHIYKKTLPNMIAESCDCV